MSVTDSWRAKRLIIAIWLPFATINAYLMYALPGAETIPYHLVWASFALFYGLVPWSRTTMVVVFSAITVVTAIPLLDHAAQGIIGWEECSEIVLMAVIAALLVWHVNRHYASQQRLADLHERERIRAENRELATRFGSHELRTRLTIARGFLDLIHTNVADDEARSDARLALTEVDKATGLATNLMTLVRVDATAALQLVDLDELLDAIVRRWIGRVERDISAHTSAGLVVTDPERLEAAVDCLIENAVKFTVDGESIRVAACLDRDEVVITVADTGAGIPPADLDRVTDVFHVSENAGERAGSGLGLAIARSTMEARGGSLQIASRLGEGTTITMRHPRGRYTRRRMFPPVESAARPAALRGPQPAEPTRVPV